ncbi:MAG TPA: DNA replication/repair protein RecF [Dokdonella sp.]|uniref:DNA replication/repair protein RecF n=1 Tax=Dokdonella sp. TaxID=2291710 RepID=UPI002D7E5716|nr:DNA replication/repair protein RecF [Dokdonella sp.]HET9031427.1 DNA replication/repair protein RecF [Dokdonella sp.]
MRLNELRINDFRIIEDKTLELVPGWNVFTGANGAGKTSVLEAAFMLSHGRSFRRSFRDSLSRIGSQGFSVFGRLRRSDGSEVRLGLARRGGKLDARADGEVVGIASLVRCCAVVCFEPGSHELINGIAEERRRYLDWGVFHVEPDFLEQWRRYQRALRQRNKVLRDGGGDDYLEPWEIELAACGERIALLRGNYVDALHAYLAPLLERFLGELGEFQLSLDSGWKADLSLADALGEGRSRDRERGFTGRGPHRADWSISFDRAPRREHLSRGQEKLCALALVLAQAQLYSEQVGEWPILCLDDLSSELDLAHQTEVIGQLQASGAQVLLSGTERPQVFDASSSSLRVFHVEHGQIMV